MEFNINNKVRVKLTQHGKNMLSYDHMKLYADFRVTPDYDPPVEDENGWSEWQMWELMSPFGKYLSNGGDMPFEPTIEIVERDEWDLGRLDLFSNPEGKYCECTNNTFDKGGYCNTCRYEAQDHKQPSYGSNLPAKD